MIGFMSVGRLAVTIEEFFVYSENMELIDNVNKTLKVDLITEIKSGGKISIAASCFSIYAFQELKEQLKDIEELRFIFTSPTFVTEKASKQKREFYIPRLNRERNLYGSEFEVKLRNELSQRAIAKECAEWIRQKVCFKSNRTNQNMMGFINVDDTNYMPINGFTTVDLGCERGNNAYSIVQKTEAPFSQHFLTLFDQLWNDNARMQVVTEEVLDNITNAYKENAPDFLYFVTLYNIFNEFLEDISEDVLPNEATGFKNSIIWNKLYNFQKDACLAIINKLEKYNGCILADSVGLGKTFTALSVIKYYENRNKSVLVLCPKKLNDNWITYRSNYINWGIIPFTLAEGDEFPYEDGDFVFVPGIRSAIEAGREEIPAKAIRKNGDVDEIILYVKGLTEDEKTIILEGCLMNYYAAQNK